jgi:DNA-binding NarL/FixJ family response regulator
MSFTHLEDAHMIQERSPPQHTQHSVWVVGWTLPIWDFHPERSTKLSWRTKGLSNTSIACRLNISRYTVINHVRNILDKTASSNRTEAVAAAQKVGLL